MILIWKVKKKVLKQKSIKNKSILEQIGDVEHAVYLHVPAEGKTAPIKLETTSCPPEGTITQLIRVMI